jgi:hypothetical protein
MTMRMKNECDIFWLGLSFLFFFFVFFFSHSQPGAPREPSAPAWCPALPDPHTYLTGRVRVVAEPKSTPDSRAADAHSAGASVLRIHAAEQAAGQAVCVFCA